MKVLFVTPEYHLDTLHYVLNDYAEINSSFLVYSDIKDIPAELSGLQQGVDAVVFTGIHSYTYTEQRVHPQVPWVVLPNEGGAVLRALMRLQRRGLDITRVSFDTYPGKLLEEVYAVELGLDPQELHLQGFESDCGYSGLIEEKIFSFHKQLYRQNSVSCCVTRLSRVHKMLEKEGVPHEYACHTVSTISHQLDGLLQMDHAAKAHTGQYAIVHLSIGFPADFSGMLPSSYQFAKLKMKITGNVYRFAELVKGIVVENAAADYTIIADKDAVEQATNYFAEIPLYQWIKQDISYLLRIGIGLGDCLSVALKNATEALICANKHDCDYAAVLDADGALSAIRVSEHPITEPKVQQEIVLAAKKCGLRQSTVIKLFAFASVWPEKLFTSADVAKELGIAKRTADRTLARLEKFGYIKVSELSVNGQKGRPPRMMEFVKLK